MNSICLSAAPNLRCEGLTRTENIALLVPAAIELIFSFTLALSKSSDSGRTHWLLVVDGVVFSILAILDFLFHIIPQASSTLIIFKIIDFVLAIAAFVPVLAYMFFLFFFARTNFTSSLPSRFKHVICFSLFAIIPPTIAFSELGSVVGIAHWVVLKDQKPVVVAGFSDTSMQRISQTFSAGALSLLTLFQAALFSLAFIRLVRAFLDERRIEVSNEKSDAPDEVHLFRGLGWLAGGLKLGAIESVVGLANVSFGTAIARRVLRLFGRGALIIGVIKGMNLVEDFVRFDSDVRARRSGIKRLSHIFISNPRNSTFRELSPQASSFHAAQQEKKRGRLGPSPLALGADSTYNAFQSTPTRRKERVTVVYDGKTPPVLQMRFSVLDVPVPPLPATLPLTTITEITEPRNTTNPFVSGRHAPADYRLFSNKEGSSKSLLVSDSARTDSLEAVHDMTSRFPALPPPAVTVTSSVHQSVADPNTDWRTRRQQRRYDGTATTPPSNISPGNSIKRKPVPPLRPEMRPSTLYRDNSGREHAAEPEYANVPAQSPVFSSTSDGEFTYSDHIIQTTPNLTRDSTLDTVTAATPTNFVSPMERSVGKEGKVAQKREVDEDAELDEKRRERLMRLRRELRPSGVVDDVAHVKDNAPNYIEDDEISEAMLDDAWRRAGLTRVVSRVRVHTTPVAEKSEAVRSSLFAVEEELGMPESYDDSNVLSQSPVRLTRLDSGVLGEEDRRLVRQGIYI